MFRPFSKRSSPTTSRRREEIRRRLVQPPADLFGFLQKPEIVNSSLILAVFLAIVSAEVIWSRDQVKVQTNQIMTTTAVKRADYTIEDTEETQSRREDARKISPRVYRVNEDYLKRLRASLEGLPAAVAGKDFEAITANLKQEFNLSESDIRNLQGLSIEGGVANDWLRLVSKLIDGELDRTLLLESREYQTFRTTLNNMVLLPNGSQRRLNPENVIELRPKGSEPSDRLRQLVENAGFPSAYAPLVLARLTWSSEPTVIYSEKDTSLQSKALVDNVAPVMVENHQGEVLYTRGDRLSADQYTQVVIEAQQYGDRAWAAQVWLQRLGIVGLIALVSVFLGSFATIAYPRIIRNPLRLTALCLLMVGMAAVTIFVTAYAPIFQYPAAIGPTLFVAIIFLVAYDQRLALLLSGIQCMLVTLALEQSIGFFLLLIAGCATSIAQLREVRHRNSLIRAATGTAAVLGVGTILLGLLDMPLVQGAVQQILIMALSTVMTSYGISFLVLGILPSIERIFDITTGMTLAELRDPKRPLLRQLQQKAPGTYNHSLQVANIAEAAAEAIGADGLLVYVGALYHDVGKINKPEYFVENQSGGQNKHEKLSPAMSLLVIIGHVKNGIELAREYGLPRPIQHFIESHHGTTLVEYFYHAAKTRAEMEEQGTVAEVEYRYPGPKPQTKEAAILMLSDAVESASRAMTEPNPSRIESLVRKLAQKRLDDGQFDQCDLTFRELALIEDAIINRLMAIYHSRISYPSGGSRGGEEPEQPKTSTQIRPVSA